MTQEEMTKVVNRLNRFHINGIQFYDWQYKHHEPVKMDGNKPAAEWPDIANRQVAYDTVKGYIDLAHGRNMKAMNYNLLFGAYEGAEADGVTLYPPSPFSHRGSKGRSVARPTDCGGHSDGGVPGGRP